MFFYDPYYKRYEVVEKLEKSERIRVSLATSLNRLMKTSKGLHAEPLVNW